MMLPARYNVRLQIEDRHARIAWQGSEWHSYLFIRDLRVIEGRPLFIAGEYPRAGACVPEGRPHEMVVWGEECYRAVDYVNEILGIFEDRPMYVGTSEAWEMQPENNLRLCHGNKEGQFNFRCVVRPDTSEAYAQKPICMAYRTQGNAHDGYMRSEYGPGWYALVGLTHSGPFDDIPHVQGRRSNQKSGTPSMTWTVTGRYRSEDVTKNVMF